MPRPQFTRKPSRIDDVSVLPTAANAPAWTLGSQAKSQRSWSRLVYLTLIISFVFASLNLCRHHMSFGSTDDDENNAYYDDSTSTTVTTGTLSTITDLEEAAPSPSSALAQQQQQQQQQEEEEKNDPSDEVELVVASTRADNTSWLGRHVPEWRANVYVTDDPWAALWVPANKGHEAMAYLTYIIDHYDRLPGAAVFVHASRFAWHNDDPDYDAVPTLRNLQLGNLAREGYVNLRCVWTIGCPAEIRPFADDDGEGGTGAAAAAAAVGGASTAKGVYKSAFQELLPGEPVPETVAVSCCSQFAVTRETVRRRPRDDYVRFRDWLLETPLDDALSGRVFEFSWHIIFGKEPVHCPNAAECYCKVFGICDTPCTQESCDGRYTLPPYSSLPEGWPRIGWEQEPRNYTGPID